MARPSPDTPILVVDDSAAIRARMESYLRRLGYTHIRTASNVEEGLRLFREEDTELVFLDLVIDEERGADFAAEALEQRPFATIVVMTALPASHEYVTAVIAEGAREFLPKPIQFKALQAVLDRLEEHRVEAGGVRGDASYV